MTTRDDIRVEGDRIILVASYFGTVTRDPGRLFPRGSIGQDGRFYLWQANFDHPFTAYVSKRTGEVTEGCEQCGWAESIHGPAPTHFECAGCGVVLPRGEEFVGSVDVHWESTFAWKGLPATIQNVQTERRLFCDESCYAANVPLETK